MVPLPYYEEPYPVPYYPEPYPVPLAVPPPPSFHYEYEYQYTDWLQQCFAMPQFSTCFPQQIIDNVCLGPDGCCCNLFTCCPAEHVAIVQDDPALLAIFDDAAETFVNTCPRNKIVQLCGKFNAIPSAFLQGREFQHIIGREIASRPQKYGDVYAALKKQIASENGIDLQQLKMDKDMRKRIASKFQEYGLA